LLGFGYFDKGLAKALLGFGYFDKGLTRIDKV